MEGKFIIETSETLGGTQKNKIKLCLAFNSNTK